MRFGLSTLLAAVFLAASGNSSFVLSPDLPDGLYVVPEGVTGLVKDIKPESNVPILTGRSPRPPLVPRGLLPNPSLVCKNYYINNSDFQSALSCIVNWCNKGNKVAPFGRVACTSGTAISYICNWGWDNPCSGAEFSEALNLMDLSCGNGKAGKVDIHDWRKAYGRDNAGVGIC